MNVKELAQRIDARLYLGAGSGDDELLRIYAADTMSDLIAHAAPGTLLVTSLCNNQLIRVAELMDVPGICLVSGRRKSPSRDTTSGCCEPSAELLSRARAAGTTILVSKVGLDETCELLGSFLGGPKVTRP
ncbi:MAG: hypothetical protein ABSG63_14625 [Spirochaetia bacterium]|jgi:hypothetical protein